MSGTNFISLSDLRAKAQRASPDSHTERMLALAEATFESAAVSASAVWCNLTSWGFELTAARLGVLYQCLLDGGPSDDPGGWRVTQQESPLVVVCTGGAVVACVMQDGGIDSIENLGVQHAVITIEDRTMTVPMPVYYAFFGFEPRG